MSNNNTYQVEDIYLSFPPHILTVWHDQQDLALAVRAKGGDNATVWAEYTGYYANVYLGASFICTLRLVPGPWQGNWQRVAPQREAVKGAYQHG